MKRAGDEAELHQRARTVFVEAVRRPPLDVPRFLDIACADDPVLRREVEALLAYDGGAGGGLFDEPALGPSFRIPPAEDLARDAIGDADPDAPPPQRIGRYAIVGVLGHGSMGTVYRAEQEHTHRTVALKVLRADPGSARALERFEFEAEVLGLLKHPGIAQVYEAGTTDVGAGVQAFFAMELVEGATITDYAEAAGLGAPERLELIRRAALAVHHAHQRGIVHRDLKPDNLLVDASGQPKILDFGVAHLTGARERGTMGGRLVGTPAYMSPEQVTRDSGALDTRSDVYSLGVIAYQLLAGELPYPVADATLTEVADLIRFHQPIPLGERARVLRGDVEAIVARALAKDRERRYASAADLAADIRRYLDGEPVSARRLTAGYQLAKFARRNRALVGTFAALVLVLLGGVATSTWLAHRARSHAQRALALNDLLLDVLRSPTAHEGDGFGVTVLEMLEGSEEEMHARLRGWPELEARLGLTLGMLYRQVGNFAGAERNLSQAFDLYRAAGGDTDRMTLEAARELVYLRVIHGEDPARAEDLLRWLLARDEEAWGPGSEELLQTRYIEGLYQRRTGDLEAAVATLRTVVAAGTRLWGRDAPFVSNARNFLARALGESGRTEEALAVAEETLALQEALLGEERRGTLISMVTLGEILLAAGAPEAGDSGDPGKLARARAVFERAVTGRRHVLGADHPGTLNARTQLARTRFLQGDRAGGIAELEAVVADFDRLYPPTQPEAHEARTHLLDLYRREGRAREADALARELERSAP